ncbi:nucleotidyltransferase domain-containing protein [Romboutsia timonensis]|uniref:nucleotidyltransferase domain-containing protein n=1 Tax=Romboutsia timonensis TaxID=1776391 RepID=UPI0034DCDBFC
MLERTIKNFGVNIKKLKKVGSKNYIYEVLKTAILYDEIEDIEINCIDVFGSRVNGNYKDNSDLDILVKYKADIKECYVFNSLNSLGIEYNGRVIDFFPIQC